jgi:predicted RecA/RadA family phage recombinase
MAVTTGQVVKRKGRDGKIRSLGVAAAKVLYEGTLCFEDAGGDATDVKVDDDTTFLGVVRETVDNSAGADGDKTVEFWTDGDFELPSASLAAADVGVAIHATDNYTTTKTATDNPAIGKLIEVVSASVGVVSIKGLGEA